jgi:hypothetical protein
MLDKPSQNKMISTPPAKKAFHFPATTEYLAEYIEAETIQEAEAIYHQIKRGVGGIAPEPAQPTDLTDEEVKQ